MKSIWENRVVRVNKSYVMSEEIRRGWFELEKGIFGGNKRYTLGEKFSASRKCIEFNPNSMDTVGLKHLNKLCKCPG